MQIKQTTIAFLLSITLTGISYAQEIQQMKGVNLAGAEFNHDKLPGRHTFDYIWPSSDDIQRSANAGFTVIRLPFLWERMQPELGGPLNNQELNYLDKVVSAAKVYNIKVILDPHDFGGYSGMVIGTPELSTEQFIDLWRKLATRYKDSPNVIFGLMNEPFKQSALEWADIAQTTVTAIRKTGASQLILVPGTHWTGAHSWLSRGISPSNAEALKPLVDPLNHFAFDLHQYFDDNSSGTHASCVSEDVGVERLQQVTNWLKANNKKGFLGEFGSSTEPVCLKALDNTLAYLKQNQDVWIGWTYWAAGKWWGNYMFSIDSMDAKTSPQFSVVKKYLVKP